MNTLENGVTFGVDTERIYWNEKENLQTSVRFYLDFDELYMYEEYSGEALTIPEEGFTEITYRDGVRFVITMCYQDLTDLYKPFKAHVITKTLNKN